VELPTASVVEPVLQGSGPIAPGSIRYRACPCARTVTGCTATRAAGRKGQQVWRAHAGSWSNRSARVRGALTGPTPNRRPVLHGLFRSRQEDYARGSSSQVASVMEGAGILLTQRWSVLCFSECRGTRPHSYADLTDRDRDESSRRAVCVWVRTNPQTHRPMRSGDTCPDSLIGGSEARTRRDDGGLRPSRQRPPPRTLGTMMRFNRIHHLVVTNGRRVLGVLSDRGAGGRRGASVGSVTVSDLLALVGRGLDRGAVTANRRPLNRRAPHRKSKGVVPAW